MRTHPVTVTYLVLGLSFLGIAGCWALTEAGVVDARAGWALPLVLVVAGGVGLVASLARGLHRTQSRAPYDEPPSDGDTDNTGDTGDLGADPRDDEPTQVLDDR